MKTPKILDLSTLPVVYIPCKIERCATYTLSEITKQGAMISLSNLKNEICTSNTEITEVIVEYSTINLTGMQDCKTQDFVTLPLDGLGTLTSIISYVPTKLINGDQCTLVGYVRDDNGNESRVLLALTNTSGDI